jgi:hypothetical protein
MPLIRFGDFLKIKIKKSDEKFLEASIIALFLHLPFGRLITHMGFVFTTFLNV